MIFLICPLLHSDDEFEASEYEYLGSQEEGWKILRNGSPYLQVGPGYKLLKTKACGVCSTDIDRRFLPHPLPQIIGHEVLAESIGETPVKQFVIEINDTFEARGDKVKDEFCKEGIPTHSPERKVLGIDRLPGGFGPYILAPQFAAIETTDIPEKVAVLMEPFAAALQAIIASPPKNGDNVAVLGPRRLGSLILSALKAHRQSSKVNFRITAITRHDHLMELSKKMGADEAIDLRKTPITSLLEKFDIVYDTTSTPSGFLSAMELAKREVHLKTTNGQVMGGISHLTELVVDELSLIPATVTNLNLVWPKETRKNQSIYIFPSCYAKWKELIPKGIKVFTGSIEDAEKILVSSEFKNKVPRFDLVIASTPSEIGSAIRPIPGNENSMVRPRSAILIDTDNPRHWLGEAKQTYDFFKSGKTIHSSRCGDFHYAMKLLKENDDVVKSLSENIISHNFKFANLQDAYQTAKDPNSVKVVVHFD